MKDVNVVLDVYSIVINLILLSYLLMYRGENQRLNRYFIWMCMSNIMMISGDLPDWLLGGKAGESARILLTAGSFLLYLGITPILIGYAKYVEEYMKRKGGIPGFYAKAVMALGAVNFLMCVATLFNGMYFWVDASNVYHRGEWCWISHFIAALMMLLELVAIMRHRKRLRVREAVFLMVYVILPMTAGIIQFFSYGIVLLGPAVTVALLLIFVNIQSEQDALLRKREKEVTDQQVELMLSQIKPHFIYNTLTGIRQLCELDPGRAREAITEFSDFLRANMSSLTSKEPIPFEQELNHVKNYLSIEQMRFGERLRVEYRIGPTDFLIPPLTLQPLAENAVRHGIIRVEEGGTVTVSTWLEGGFYVAAVEDDGIGFQVEGEKDGIHIGLRNVRRRIEELCGGSMSVVSSPGKGTVVLIKIPGGGYTK